MFYCRCTLIVCLIASIGWGVLIGEEKATKPASELKGLPLLFQADFEDCKSDAWGATTPAAWKVEEQHGNKVFHQFQHKVIETPVRSPFNRAVIKDLLVSDFVLDLKLQSTARDYPHRSLCLFFGYQDPAHMYYVHFGQKTDDHANQIFIVNNEPRKKISTETTSGTPWDDKWHHARIVRNIETGSIEVFFDDMEKPVMKAVDKTFTWGQVGVGSFDDTGRFDDVLVYGKKATKP